MKRRFFLQRLGLGTTGILASPNLLNANPARRAFHEVNRLEDIFSAEGQVILRFNYRSDDVKHLASHEGRFRIRKGELARMKSYFFYPAFDEIDPGHPAMDIESSQGLEDVVVLWIDGASERTEVSFPLGTKTQKANIREIFDAGDLEFNDGDAALTVSYLLDREMGEINPADAGIKDPGNEFAFTVMADPQGGNPFAHEKVHTRMRIHNAFIDESVKLVNAIEPAPAFNIVIGDIVDGQGHHADFNAMNEMLSEVTVPNLYEVGNHETRYKSVFSPGYNLKAFDNYFAAQKEMNGMEKLLYSYNLGAWHFIVWPDPLRNRFWQTHPHYFDWLERDLEKHRDRPTIFFQHIPMHPIGILPLINYAESVDVKRTLLDLLARHGNVKYILSGHVHIPMKASVKTSVSYRGMKMINLPAAGYRPRAFGEEEYNGGPSQGIAIVHIKGSDASVDFKTVTTEQFTYPEPEPFRDDLYPLWLNHKWELAHGGPLNNGDFSEGLSGWHRRYVYTEDVHPSNIAEVRQTDQEKPYLYLFNKSRGYSTPGQDRLPQSINRICQVVTVPDGTDPAVKLKFMLDPEYYRPELRAGAYIWLEGFERGLKRLNVVYSNDYVHWHLGGDQSQLRTTLPVHLDITDQPGSWHDLELYPVRDFLRFTEDTKIMLDHMDTFAINFGVWTINEGLYNAAGAGFRDVQLSFTHRSNTAAFSTMNGNEIRRKKQKYLWWHGVKHHAGEHKSYIEDLDRYIE